MDIAATFDEEPFRHSDPKYKCCCGHIHVKQGARYLFILAAIGVLVLILSLILDFASFTWASLIGHLIVISLAAGAVFCLFWAIRTENEKFLIPFLIWLVIGVLFCLFLLVVALWSLIDPESEPARVANNFIPAGNSTVVADQGLHEHRTAIQVLSSFAVVGALLFIAIDIWFAFVIYKYYLYLIAMKRARNPQNVVHHDMNTLKKGVHQ